MPEIAYRSDRFTGISAEWMPVLKYAELDCYDLETTIDPGRLEKSRSPDFDRGA